MTDKQLRRWAFTCFSVDKIADLKETLREVSRRWVFQLEKCPTTGREHIQGRVSFKTPKRMAEAGKMLLNSHMSAEVNEKSSTFYCMKPDRVAGPWSDKDVERYIPKRFRNPTLREWQQVAIEKLRSDLERSDDRTINLVVDPEGNNGKSFLIGYLKSNLGAKLIPASCQAAEDMVQALADQVNDGWEGTVVVDLPRATSNRHWFLLAQGIETIKNGFLYDKRYNYTETVIEPPAILVVCNQDPPEGVFTSDRWNRIEIGGSSGAAL